MRGKQKAMATLLVNPKCYYNYRRQSDTVPRKAKGVVNGLPFPTTRDRVHVKQISDNGSVHYNLLALESYVFASTIRTTFGYYWLMVVLEMFLKNVNNCEINRSARNGKLNES